MGAEEKVPPASLRGSDDKGAWVKSAGPGGISISVKGG